MGVMGAKRTCSEKAREWGKWAKRQTRYGLRGAVDNMERMAPALASSTLVGLADRFLFSDAYRSRYFNNRYYREHPEHALGESIWNMLTVAVMAAPVVTHLASKKITEQFPDKNQAEVVRSILGLGVVAAIALPFSYSVTEVAIGYGAYRGFVFCKKHLMKFIKSEYCKYLLSVTYITDSIKGMHDAISGNCIR